MRISFSLVTVVLLALPHMAPAQSCSTVELDAGFDVGDIQGTAPTDGTVCYDLRFPQGQNLSVELVSGNNVSISVAGHYDNRNERMFLGDLPGNLEVRVFQLMRSANNESFSIRIRFEEPGNG